MGFFIFRVKDEDDNKNGVDAITFSPHVRGYFKTEGKALPYAEVEGASSA